MGAGLGVLVLFFAASRVTRCVFARDVRRKKRARQRLLRRQTELRERRAMLRRVARRLAEDAAQYAKLAEATDDGSDGRFEASGGPVGGSGDGDGAVGGGARMYAGNRAGIGVRAHGRRERSGLGSGAAAQDDVGMVEIARSPRYSPRYSPGPNGVAARGWRGPGSYREYLGSNPDGDGNDPGFGAGFGSVQGRARVASSSFPASGARTPARIASARAAAATAAAAAVAAAAAKLAALTGQQLRRGGQQISSDYSDEEEDAAGGFVEGGGRPAGSASAIAVDVPDRGVGRERRRGRHWRGRWACRRGGRRGRWIYRRGGRCRGVGPRGGRLRHDHRRRTSRFVVPGLRRGRVGRRAPTWGTRSSRRCTRGRTSAR